MELQQGFVLTRHWHDTPEGTCVEFWLATDQGPRQLRLAPQESVAFIPEESVSFFVCGPITACRQAGQAFTRSA